MAGAFQANAFQNNAFQTSGVTPTPTLTTDKHDGFIDETPYEDRPETKKKRAERDLLREILEAAYDEKYLAIKPAEQVREISAPHVERLESGALDIDWETISAADAKEILAFEESIKSAIHAARLAEEDDNDAILLL